jgi:VWFA-related protein
MGMAGAGLTQNLKVTFEQVSIHDTTEFRDVRARFPHPVLSVITVQDSNKRYVHGLADTSRWLSESDTNQLGGRVDEVWDTILEYHEENTSYPPDPDVKSQSPGYRVTELMQVKGFGLSVPMVMDYSGSMGDGIYIAEDAARTFVRAMGKYDRSSIIKFTGKVQVFQEFTGDTTRLIDAIVARYPEEREYTALFDALYMAVAQVKPQSGRRVVVGYTDGADNASSHTLEDVIRLAREEDIPVYTIGLGSQIRPEELSRIAEETGGVYLFASTAEELADIYLQIFGLIRGYYVMAHTTTDPINNGTYRIVDLTIRHGNTTGNGKGKYYAPYIPADLEVFHRAYADSMAVIAGDTAAIATAGDSVFFQIRAGNRGSGAAPDSRLVLYFPDSLDVGGFSPEPDALGPESCSWELGRVDPLEYRMFRYSGRLHRKLPLGENPLGSAATVSSTLDSLYENNSAASRLIALGLADLKVECLSPPRPVSPGYLSKLHSRIYNEGNADVPRPFAVDYAFTETAMPSLVQDTLASILIGDSLASSGDLFFPQAGAYPVRIIADIGQAIPEMNRKDNEETCVIQAGYDSLWIRVNDVSFSDSSRGTQARFPDTLLASILVGDQNGHAVHGLAGSGSWAGLNDLSDNGTRIADVWQVLREMHRDDPALPVLPDVRPSARFTEIRNGSVGLVLSTDFSAGLAPWKPAADASWSRFIDRFAGLDQAAVVGMNGGAAVTQPFTSSKPDLKQKLTGVYQAAPAGFLEAVRTGLNTAWSVPGRNALFYVTGGFGAGGASLFDETVSQAQEAGLPVFVIHLSGAVSDSLRLLCEATGGWYVRAADGPDLEHAFSLTEDFLRNYYVVSYTSPDTLKDRNWRALDVQVSSFGLAARDTGFYRVPLGSADIAIRKQGAGKSISAGGDAPLRTVQAGDSVLYTLSLSNIGHQDVPLVSIVDILAPNLRLARSGVSPVSQSGDTVRWSLPGLAIGGRTSFEYACFVDTLDPDVESLLINRSFLDIPQDTVSGNNSDSDTLSYRPLAPVDLVVTKWAQGDSFSVSSGDTAWYVHPGGRISYQVLIVNSGERDCPDAAVRDLLPDRTRFVTGDAAIEVRNDTLSWTAGRIASRGGSKAFTYVCEVDSLMPPWSMALINRVEVICPQDARTDDNAAMDTVWAVGIVPPDPAVRVSPEWIEPRDSVAVQVWSPVETASWDLVVLFEDGSRIADFADPFIRDHTLMPDSWTSVSPRFGETLMRTAGEEETVSVILVTTDSWGVTRSDTARFRIRSSNEFYLDENVFNAGSAPLGLRFKLSSNRDARITVYDVSGAYVSTVALGPHPAGWNRGTWDGCDDAGRPQGSGIYVAVLQAGSFRKAHKFILIR